MFLQSLESSTESWYDHSSTENVSSITNLFVFSLLYLIFILHILERKSCDVQMNVFNLLAYLLCPQKSTRFTIYALLKPLRFHLQCS